MTVRLAKTQISPCIRQVWSESSLCVQWVAENPDFIYVDSEDSLDWADAQANLSSLDAHAIFLVLSAAHFSDWQF